MTDEEILADYDDLEPDDLRAATAFAARMVRRVACSVSGREASGRRATASSACRMATRGRLRRDPHPRPAVRQPERPRDHSPGGPGGEEIVVTKDEDSSIPICSEAARLLLISTGNISNRDLDQLLRPLISDLVRALEKSDFVEVGREGLVIRG